jgi:hypothetical protein
LGGTADHAAESASDAAAEGERICVELIEELAGTRGIAGVHVMAPAYEAALPRVVAEVRWRLANVGRS